ncbi:MAG TPA: class A beta-lactamase-related serine hydrolase [Vicinamibacterales bacterium]|nr:class A beta-lactamase-related serine hydrolase [Vicinamibacterales bacterium]
MLIRATLVAFALWVMVGQMVPTPRPPEAAAQAAIDLAKIRAEVDALIAASGAEVAVAWRPLSGTKGEEILIRPDLRFHAASTMKVPVMIELFRQVENGLRKLDDKVLVTNQFTSIFDGSPYILSATEDSDGETYKAMGKPLSLRALVDASITVSSNLATNILIEHLRATNVQATVDTMGAVGMQVMRGVEDQKAFDAGKNNTTDARGLLVLFEAIGRGTAVNPKASAAMIEILKRQKFNDGIPAGLPADTPVAHKTGWITRIHHDAGIVYAARPYVLVILTRGIADRAVSAKLMADISRVIARAAN